MVALAPATIATLQTIGTVVTVASTVMNAVSSIQTGNANNKILQAQAAQREQEAQRRADIRRKQGETLRGQQRVQMAASGVDISSGSFLDLAAETEQNNMLDQLTILRGGQNEASLLRAQGKQAKSEGQAGFVSGLLGAGAQSTKLFGTGNIYNPGKEWKNPDTGEVIY